MQQDGALAAAMLSVGYNYVSREGEIMPMRVDQIDFADRTIRLEVGTTKNGHGRIVKMTQEVYMLIQACALRKQLTITSSLERMIPVLDFRSACREASVRAVSESSTAETAIT